jgi:hypothetical protein
MRDGGDAEEAGEPGLGRRQRAEDLPIARLEGAVRGIRITQLPPADRARLRLLARLGREADQSA